MPLPDYIRESYAPSGTVRVDREKGLVSGVRLLGPKSLNGHTYPESVMRAAVALYDDRPVNLGHFKDLTADVPLSARFGRTTNPRFENGGVVGDLRFNPQHPLAGSQSRLPMLKLPSS